METVKYLAEMLQKKLKWQKDRLDSFEEIEGQSKLLESLQLDNKVMSNACESLLRAIERQKVKEQ